MSGAPGPHPALVTRQSCRAYGPRVHNAQAGPEASQRPAMPTVLFLVPTDYRLGYMEKQVRGQAPGHPFRVARIECFIEAITSGE